MPSNRIHSAVLAIATSMCIAAAMHPACVLGDVIVNTFDASGGFSPSSAHNVASVLNSLGSTSATRSAVAFVPTVTFTLSSVTIPISRQGPASAGLRIRLAADSGDAPGSTIEVLSQNASIVAFTTPFTTATVFDSTAHPTLAANTKYWIVTEPTSFPSLPPNSGLAYGWSLNTSGVTSGVRTQSATGALPTDPWTGSITQLALALRIEGIPVLAACCTPSTAQCAVIALSACQSLGLTPITATLTCSPSPCPPPPPPICPADFDHDGHIAVPDIFGFLAAWFAGCP